MEKQIISPLDYALASSAYSFTQRIHTRTNMLTQEFLNWSLGVIAAGSAGYGYWVNKKSKKYKEAEEGEKFIDSAVKLTDVWEKLSSNLQVEIKYLRDESKEMLEKYTLLKIDFEVSKGTSAVLIENLSLENERLKMENDRLRAENKELIAKLGGGVVKKING